jgi:hypothetical protein
MVTTDASRPLAPLDPQLVSHLNQTLGPPASHLLERQGDRDLRVAAWTVGFGRIGVGGNDESSWQRGTDVEILLTEGGLLVTTRRSWTRSEGGGRHDSQTGQVHETPAAAYRWLLADGKGKLGPASKTAWIQACRTVPTMSGLDVDEHARSVTHTRRLSEVFPRGSQFAVSIARLSVLFEDLRLENDALTIEPIPKLETVGKYFRYYYFLRRTLVSIDEFVSALHTLNADSEWKKIRATFDADTERRWSAAVDFLTTNRSRWSTLRNEIGGHFKKDAAEYAVTGLPPGDEGKIEIILNDVNKTGGIRLHYAADLVGIAIYKSLGPGQHTRDEVAAYANRLFTVVREAVNHAVTVVHTIGVVYIVDHFRSSR